MTIAEQLRQEGEQKGEARGYQLGRQEGVHEGVQIGRNEGRQEGRQEGEHSAKLKIAREMLTQGMHRDAVKACTGLADTELVNLFDTRS